jgi:hypothetical protein
MHRLRFNFSNFHGSQYEFNFSRRSSLSLRLRNIRLANVVILAFSCAMLFLCVSWDTVYAACTVQNTSINNAFGGDSTLGQSFTATCSGQISTITIQISAGQSVVNGTLNFYSGESVASPTYTQAGINLADGVQTVTLTTPQSVTSGSNHAWSIIFRYLATRNVLFHCAISSIVFKRNHRVAR